tara:strand:+ start:402 stop:575 length:174 start_codon:yes stop_codon:yes gene_type:complete
MAISKDSKAAERILDAIRLEFEDIPKELTRFRLEMISDSQTLIECTFLPTLKDEKKV